MTPIEAIKSTIRFDDYAARYLDIKNGKATCPVHKEKTASFVIHPLFGKCFGCGWHCDVIAFAAEYHGLSTGAAIRMLADEGGITLTRQPAVHPYDAAKAERIRAEAEEWRRQSRAALLAALNRSIQDQPPWVPVFIERSPCVPDVWLPRIDVEWILQPCEYPEPDDSYSLIAPFLERLEALSRGEALEAYKDQRTPEQAAMLRESIRESDQWEKAMKPLISTLIDRLASALETEFVPEPEFPQAPYGPRCW